MFRRLISIFALTAASIASAADFGIEAGIRSQSGDFDASGYSTSSKSGFQLGGVGHFELSGPWHIRSGLLYTQRPISISVTGGSADDTITHFDVPAQMMYKFEDYGSVFAGPVMALLVDKSCSGSGNLSGCKVEDANGIVIPFQLGATFKFAPQIGATMYYELVSGALAKYEKNYRAVGLNLLITFD